MADEPFYAPGRKPTPAREPRHGEVLFEFIRNLDQAHFRCELRSHDGWGIEAQFWMNGELLIGRRFDTRALAVQWAMAERQALEQGCT
jgi:glutaredoxin-related protein